MPIVSRLNLLCFLDFENERHELKTDQNTVVLQNECMLVDLGFQVSMNVNSAVVL